MLSYITLDFVAVAIIGLFMALKMIITKRAKMFVVITFYIYVSQKSKRKEMGFQVPSGHYFGTLLQLNYA